MRPAATPPRRQPFIALLLVMACTQTAPGADSPARLAVEPHAIRLDGAQARQQLAVTGQFADGSAPRPDDRRPRRRRAGGGRRHLGGRGCHADHGWPRHPPHPGRRPGRRGAGGSPQRNSIRPAELPPRRRRAAGEGRVQHGGVPRQPERQGGVQAQPPGGRSRRRPARADEGCAGAAGRSGRPRREPDPAQADRTGPARGGAGGSPGTRSRRRPSAAGSPPARPTTRRPP